MLCARTCCSSCSKAAAVPVAHKHWNVTVITVITASGACLSTLYVRSQPYFARSFRHPADWPGESGEISEASCLHIYEKPGFLEYVG